MYIWLLVVNLKMIRSWPEIAIDHNMSHDKTKNNKMSVRPAKTQISLGIRQVWPESSLCAQWVAKDSSFLHADSEDSDQTGRMPRLIWVFAGRTVTLLVLSCCGSYIRVRTWQQILKLLALAWDWLHMHTFYANANVTYIHEGSSIGVRYLNLWKLVHIQHQLWNSSSLKNT